MHFTKEIALVGGLTQTYNQPEKPITRRTIKSMNTMVPMNNDTLKNLFSSISITISSLTEICSIDSKEGMKRQMFSFSGWHSLDQ